MRFLLERVRLVLSFLLLIALPLAAAEAATTGPKPLALGDMLRGRFTQERVLAGFSKPLVTEGTFLLVPRRGLIWQSERPFKSTVVISAFGIFQLVNGEEAMRLPASGAPGLDQVYLAFEAAISGDTTGVEKSFDVARTGNNSRWQIRLVPHSGDLLKALTLSGSTFVDRVDVDKAGGDSDHLTFTAQTEMPINLSADETALLGNHQK